MKHILIVNLAILAGGALLAALVFAGHAMLCNGDVVHAMVLPFKFLSSGHAKPFTGIAGTTIIVSMVLAIWQRQTKWISYATCSLWILSWFCGMFVAFIAGTVG